MRATFFHGLVNFVDINVHPALGQLVLQYVQHIATFLDGKILALLNLIFCFRLVN